MAKRSNFPKHPDDVLRLIGRDPVRFSYAGRNLPTRRYKCVELLSAPKLAKGSVPFNNSGVRGLIDNGLDAVSSYKLVMKSPRAEKEGERIIFAGALWRSVGGFVWVLVTVERGGIRVFDLEDYHALMFMSETLGGKDRFAVISSV